MILFKCAQIFDGLCWILFNSEFGVQTDSAHPDHLNVVFLNRAFDLSTQKHMLVDNDNQNETSQN